MSVLIPIARSTFLREALSRSLSSSRILTKVRVLGTKIQDTCCFTSFTKKEKENNVSIRYFTTKSGITPEEKKEKRKELIEKEKKSVLNFGHKFKELGGTKVVIAYFGLEAACIAGFYAAFKAGLVSPDSIVALMNRWEITAKFSHIIANNPNASLFTLAYASTKAISPLRMALIAGYGTYVVKKEKKILKNETQKCNCQKEEGGCKHGDGQCCGGHGHGEGQCCGKHGEGNGCCGGHGHGNGECCGGHGDGQCKHGDGQCKHGEGNGCCGGHGDGQCKHGGGHGHGNGECCGGHGEGNGCCGGHGDGQCKHGDGHGHGNGECCGGHGDGQCKHGDGQCCGKHGEGNGCCGGHGHGDGQCKHGDGQCCGGHGHGDGHCKHGQCKNKSSPSECIVGIME